MFQVVINSKHYFFISTCDYYGFYARYSKNQAIRIDRIN